LGGVKGRIKELETQSKKKPLRKKEKEAGGVLTTFNGKNCEEGGKPGPPTPKKSKKKAEVEKG